MSRIGLAAAAAMMLAAGCGDGVNIGAGREAWIEQCRKGGDDRRTCVCVANDLQANLDAAAFKAMILDARGEREQARRLREGMPMDRRMAAMNVAMKAADKCAARTVRLRAPSLNTPPPAASLPDNK